MTDYSLIKRDGAFYVADLMPDFHELRDAVEESGAGSDDGKTAIFAPPVPPVAGSRDGDKA